ncbi:MAG: sigma-54-dependent Fis family transcriptional regulator [Gemmatimonadetes bacterium]|jgi:DNA-binding NtrC family response regulator|nr:sigma-54-dependent Fis family transcriptional regulator [Gemmatimonadota bacterium]MBT6144124.1 sigma-54-dependent Fis family transcriptional regulator [Gemmatimonadota bacterium]MBT7859869.1 sigma-54-dependent Fis family transcriptional regulator [Gemmatimonadota bacterium]
MQPLPSPLHLRQLKNQAKDLRDACRVDDPEALSRLRQHHPQHTSDSRRDVSLQDAQLVIAREQGFDSWPKLTAAAGQQSTGVEAGYGFVGDGPLAQRVRQLLASAAAVRTPVLLIGEPGTGKRLCARIIHAGGPRASAPFGRVSCGGNATLIDSELFGHEQDAFTGARAPHAGQLQTGDGGSLLLDEVESLDEEVQTRLQAYLDGGRFRRLGGEAELASDVRIIASSTRPLQPDLAAALREDLFYGLSVLAIQLPPLRDRLQDVEALVQHFAQGILSQRGADSQAAAPVFTPEAMAALRSHDWPGNVRQLQSVVERASLTTQTAQITAEQLQLTDVSSVDA